MMPLDPRGLQFNENVCALLSMMARSTARSNRRPDTLMQDRKPTDRQDSLATHGRTIHCGREIVNAVLIAIENRVRLSERIGQFMN